MNFRNFRTLAGRMAVLTLAGASLAPAVAMADGAIRTSSVAPSGFNWLANGAQLSDAELQALLQARQIQLAGSMGDGTWICSPAGFGQRSHCYRR